MSDTTPVNQPTKAFDERKARKHPDDPQKTRDGDEPSSPETSGSVKSIPVDDLNASNDK